MQFSLSLPALAVALTTFHTVSASISWGTICTDTNFGGTCTTYKSASSDECINLTGSNSFWNDDISSLSVNSGDTCFFYINQGCPDEGAGDIFPAGSYNTVPSNDAYSSFGCVN